MPTLIAVAFMEKANTPFVWKCSACEEVFALERMTPMPTATQVEKVNAAFREHSRHTHADSRIVGISAKLEPEDISQVVARIVREATENH